MTAPGPAEPGRERLLATCWSSAGDAASDRDDLHSPVPLRERIEAASAAGFRGFGLLSADLPAAEQEYGLKGIRAMLDDDGIGARTPVVDLPGMIAGLRTVGWAGPWGVEILSAEHRSLPVRDALARAADGTRRQLELARRPAVPVEEPGA